jgi:hypothetical protein
MKNIHELEARMDQLWVWASDAAYYGEGEREHALCEEIEALEVKIAHARELEVLEEAANSEALYYESLEDRLCGRR